MWTSEPEIHQHLGAAPGSTGTKRKWSRVEKRMTGGVFPALTHQTGWYMCSRTNDGKTPTPGKAQHGSKERDLQAHSGRNQSQRRKEATPRPDQSEKLDHEERGLQSLQGGVLGRGSAQAGPSTGRRQTRDGCRGGGRQLAHPTPWVALHAPAPRLSAHVGRGEQAAWTGAGRPRAWEQPRPEARLSLPGAMFSRVGLPPPSPQVRSHLLAPGE